MQPPAPSPVPLEQTRQQTIRQLCEHYAVDNLSAEALEARLDRAHAAATLDDLRALTADLPVVATPAAAPASVVAPAPAGHVPEREFVIGIMGGAERKGAWTPPRTLYVVAVMGGVELDLREARFGPGVTEIVVFALMGGAEIIVPPGVHVEMSGLAVMGGFGQAGASGPPPAPGAPVVRVGGFCLMGGVDLQVRYPGERPKEARARARLETQQHRLDNEKRRLELERGRDR